MCNISLPEMVGVKPLETDPHILENVGRNMEEKLTGLTSLDNFFEVFKWYLGSPLKDNIICLH